MNTTLTPLEQMLRAGACTRRISIGLPASESLMERRFPLTPEAAGMLVERGYTIKMEAGAADAIHYPDGAYAARGVEIVERAEALGSEIVISLPMLTAADVSLMRPGALLLTFANYSSRYTPVVLALLRRHVITLALDLLADENGHRPFADVLSEINGRAALALASSLLADPVHGKGILLGGVAGIVPCEVMVIGSDLAAEAAAGSAVGLGATVRLFSNNTVALRNILGRLGSGVIGSSVHPKVYDAALRSADIIVATGTLPPGAVVDALRADTLKRGVIAFDLTDEPGSAFPSRRVIDLDLASAADMSLNESARVCYIHAGNAVPRTVAMAMSNTFLNVLDDILVCDGVANALKLHIGLRRSALTFLGKCVNLRLARQSGVKYIDVELFLQFS